ncbi:MAG: N-(5'-phosphoribosyl)anthranilate isomerase [Pyrinomonadaceae bacterium]
MTLVKICGITNLEDARHALDSGADELGFNFYRGSKRYISPQEAREIIDQLPITSGNVGVFVNEPIDELLETTEFVGLDGIQLHGDEDIAYVNRLNEKTNLFMIKVFPVSPAFDVSKIGEWNVNFHLFDTYSPLEKGGTGETFDWDTFGVDIYLWVPETAYLAGGLTPENVADAIRIVRPYAVDVASGVESSPGKKDPRKVEEFIRNAKNAL